MNETDKRVIIIIAAFVSAFLVCFGCFMFIVHKLFGSPDNYRETIKVKENVEAVKEYLKDKYDLDFVAVTSNNSIYYYPSNNSNIIVTVLQENDYYSDNYLIQRDRYNIENVIKNAIDIETVIRFKSNSANELSVYYYSELFNLSMINFEETEDFICYFYKVSYEDFLGLQSHTITEIDVDLEYEIINKNNEISIVDYRR